MWGEKKSEKKTVECVQKVTFTVFYIAWVFGSLVHFSTGDVLVLLNGYIYFSFFHNKLCDLYITKFICKKNKNNFIPLNLLDNIYTMTI